MTMKTKLFICLGVLFGVAAAAQQVGWPLAKLTVHVLGEEGELISGANVRIGFREKLSNRDVWAVGATDSDGKFTAEGYSDKRLGGSVGKEGYYDSGTGWTIFNDAVLGKWRPWNSVAAVVLRPIGKPVALCAKTGWFDIPVVSQPCGFDMMKGDWVAPYGSGVIADMVFTVERRHESRQDFEVKMHLGFSNARDGIQETKLPAIGRNSAFQWQREAVQEGYAPVLTGRFAHKPGGPYEKTASEDQVYFFRVRTVERDGRIVSANYGKIRGGLELAPSNSATCKIKLTYYLNPTSLDRNLEWDTKRNLLTSLGAMEAPREP